MTEVQLIMEFVGVLMCFPTLQKGLKRGIIQYLYFGTTPYSFML